MYKAVKRYSFNLAGDAWFIEGPDDNSAVAKGPYKSKFIAECLAEKLNEKDKGEIK